MENSSNPFSNLLTVKSLLSCNPVGTDTRCITERRKVEGEREELTGRINIKGLQQRGEHFTASDEKKIVKENIRCKNETLYNLYYSPFLVG
jgi:hypothetical protein